MLSFSAEEQRVAAAASSSLATRQKLLGRARAAGVAAVLHLFIDCMAVHVCYARMALHTHSTARARISHRLKFFSEQLLLSVLFCFFVHFSQ